MKVGFVAVLLVPSLVSSFTILSPVTFNQVTDESRSKLDSVKESDSSGRRNFMGLGIAIAANILSTEASNAFTHETYFLSDSYIPTSQLAPSDKLDVNSAFVGDYKKLRGMFPHAAGQIASNGPYKSVKDIYDIKTLTEHDLKLFKMYERDLTCLPPTTRIFRERINARVST